MANPIYNPTQVLSGNALKALVNRLAGMQFNPQIKEARRQYNLAKVNDQALLDRIGGYNKFVNNQMSGLVADTRAREGGLRAGLTANEANLNQGLSNIRAGEEKSLADDTALRGQGLDGGMSQRLTADFTRQQAGVQSVQGAQDNAALVQGSGWSGLMGIMKGAAAMRGADNLTTVANEGANREQGLNDKVSGLISQKGAASADLLLKTRQQEFEKAAAVQTLGIKQTQANAAAMKAARVPETQYQKEVGKWSAKLGITPHEFSVLSPAQRQKMIHDYNNAGKTSGKSLDQINAENMSREAARHGYTYEEWQKLTPQQRQQIASGKTGQRPKSQWLSSTAQVHSVSDATRLLADPTLAQVKAKGAGYNETRQHLLGSGSRYAHMQPGVINAVLDKVYLGYMTKGTVNMLHEEGIQANRIARALKLTIGKQKTNWLDNLAKQTGQ